MPYPKAVRRLLRNMGRDMVNQRSYGSETERNYSIRAMLDRCSVDGKIGVILSGMDCDCTQYYREAIMDTWTSVAAFKRYWDQHCDWLDGPETQVFVRPDQVTPQHRSRDLAMEAYEDGHPHIVYLCDPSELPER